MAYMVSWPPKPKEVLLEIVRSRPGWQMGWAGWHQIEVIDPDGREFKLMGSKLDVVRKEARKLGLEKQYDAALFAFGLQ